MILLKKQITKLLIRFHGCAGWSAPLLLQITKEHFSQSLSNFTMNALKYVIFVEYDITRTELLFAQSLQSICSVYLDTPRVILLVTVFFIISLIYESKHGNHGTV